MDPRIIDLKSTPCSGRCEHLHWTTAKGGSRVGAGLGMLETLERRSVLTRPPPAWRYRTMPEGERFAVRAAIRAVEASG